MSERKPMILVLAGPNGSGKSTITQYFDIVGTYTNADDMVAATGMSNQEAAILADEKRLENPWYWTIDREKKSYLFGVYYVRDFLMKLCLFLYGITNITLFNF